MTKFNIGNVILNQPMEACEVVRFPEGVAFKCGGVLVNVNVEDEPSVYAVLLNDMKHAPLRQETVSKSALTKVETDSLDVQEVYMLRTVLEERCVEVKVIGRIGDKATIIMILTPSDNENGITDCDTLLEMFKGAVVSE